ncbi:hypothetical protein [Bradyrhizobium genosp. A]|uniref:hypothetical protein n=1 Tax=Bradyrhizobium genosp. A TaxID=83626 RepID=UPI003CE70B0D
MLADDVFGKLSLSAFAVAFNASSADGPLSIADVPHRGAAFGFEEGEPWAFAGTRHLCLISSMSRKVVKSLPQSRSIVSNPARAHRRRALTDIEPSGYARRQATDSRNGVVSVTASGSGILIAGLILQLGLGSATYGVAVNQIIHKTPRRNSLCADITRVTS